MNIQHFGHVVSKLLIILTTLEYSTSLMARLWCQLVVSISVPNRNVVVYLLILFNNVFYI